MLTICTYPLDAFGARRVIAAMLNHQCILTKQAGEYVLLSSGEGKNFTTTDAPKRKRQLTQQETRFIRSGFEGFSDKAILRLFLNLCLHTNNIQKIIKQYVAATNTIALLTKG